MLARAALAAALAALAPPGLAQPLGEDHGHPAMLVGLKPGDRVRFSADRLGGVLTIIRLEAAK